MARDVWQEKLPGVETKRINKKLILPAFSLDTFYNEQCLKTVDNAPTNGLQIPNAGYNLSSAFTVECWVYLHEAVEGGASRRDVFYANVIDTSGVPQVEIGIYNNLIIVYLYRGPTFGYYTLESVNEVPIGEWFHVAVTYNGTTLRTFLNGKLESSVAATGALSQDPGGIYHLGLLSSYDNTRIFYGYIDEVRVWSSALANETILLFYDKAYHSSTAGLVTYFNFADAEETDTLLRIPNFITGGSTYEITLTGIQVELSIARNAPVGMGASWIVAEYTVTLDEETSLLFPLARPSGATNFGLYVSWVDEDGEFQRRRLFDPEDITLDIAHNVTDYNGEKLAVPFKFEVFCVDGRDTASLAEDLDIYLATTSLPQDSIDHTSVTEETLTADITLGEPSPWSTFPIPFNTQQTY
jgi:hypothetical protein